MTHAGRRIALIAGAIAGLIALTGFAAAQVDCDAMVGPARTDCQIGNARINKQTSAIAAGIARQRADAANLHRLTGRRLTTNPARKAFAD